MGMVLQSVQNTRIRIFVVVCMVFVLLPFAASFAQWVSIPDSEYVPDQLIVWFRPGVLNYEYFGCNEDGSIGEAETEFPVSTDFIRDENLVTYLTDAGAVRMKKVVPFLVPCRDTLSITRSGDTIPVPDFWNMMLIEFNSDGSDVDIPNMAVFLTMMYQPAIRIAEPNFVIQYAAVDKIPPLRKVAFVTPNEPNLSNQGSIRDWEPNNNLFGTQIYSNKTTTTFAWQKTQGSGKISIGIIDDGIDDRHQDFGGSGKVVKGGYNYSDTSKPFNYATWHGTRISGIIGALSNNNYGIAGIAGGTDSTANDNVKLIALKIGDGFTQQGTAHMSAAIPAIVHGATGKISQIPDTSGWGCNILNMSWVSMPSEELRSVIVYSYLNNVLNLCAMGNTVSYKVMEYDKPKYPAGIDDQWVTSIGGSSQAIPSVNSIHGISMDILAPFGNASIGVDDNSGSLTYYPYVYCVGTSFSTPHVAGIAALLLAYRDTLESLGVSVPDYLAPEDVTMLMAEGTSVRDQNAAPIDGVPLQKTIDYGYGIVNADSTLIKLAPPYTLEHVTVEIPIDASSFTLDTVAVVFPSKYRGFTPIKDSLSIVEVRKYHVVQSNVQLPKSYPHIKRAWNRGGTATKGAYPDIRRISIPTNSQQTQWYTTKLPLYRNAGWANVLEFSASKCKIETYIYQWSPLGQNRWSWLDIDTTDSKIYVGLSILSDENFIVNVGDNTTRKFEIISAYPNPVQSTVSNFSIDVYSATNQKVNIQICDLLGRSVDAVENICEMNQGQNTITINTQNIAKGVYFVKIVAQGLSHTLKMVIAR